MVTPTVGGAEGTKYPSNFDDFKKKSPFTAETLTKKDHDEPELHFIGDALPVPSMVATTGNITIGTSPIPAREDHFHGGGGGGGGTGINSGLCVPAAATTLTNGVYTTINWGTPLWNEGGWIIFGGGAVCHTPGRYLVIAQAYIGVSDAASWREVINIFVNSVAVTPAANSGNPIPITTTDTAQQCSTIVNLVDGDVVEVRFYQNTGVNQAVSVGFTNLRIERLGGITGPIGPQGVPGPAGIQGPQGEIGGPGPQGIQGISGVKGDTGSQGPKGDTGDTGATGSQGPIGNTGPTGNTGAQGTQGIQGPIGPQGDIGPQGIQGIKGDTGSQGAQGPQGIQGIPGTTGSQGPPGIAEVWYSGTTIPGSGLGIVGDWYLNTINGEVYEKTGTTTWTLRANIFGPMGPQGSQGIQGPIGNTGPQGIQGPIGPEGPQGPAGEGSGSTTILDGTATPTGSTGEEDDYYLDTDDHILYGPKTGTTWPVALSPGTGAVGPQGPEGPPGPQGIQGIKGDTGNTGATGTTGATGSQGIQGIQGIQGTPGEKWFSGTANPTVGTGAEADWYLNTTSGDIFEKSGGVWVSRGNLRGPQGTQGIQGIQGTQGPTGNTGTQGPQGLTGNTGAQGIQGPTGLTGDTGPQGSTGSTGSPGTPGEKWFSGSGAPSGATGIVGDWYLDTANGDVYEKTGTSTWTSRGNIKGATGSQGPQGIQGTAGTAGATGAQGIPGPEGPQGIQGNTGATGATGLGIPIGGMSMWAGASTTVPLPYLWCDGAAVSRTTYPELFTAIGTYWGVGDGTTTFNLPDMTSFFARGGGTVGGTGGTADQIVVSHSHTQPTHTHTLASHTHTQPTHTHTLSSHTHNTAHTHTMPHSHEISLRNTTGTGGGAALGSAVENQKGVTGGPSNASTGATSDATSAGPSNNTSGADGNDVTGGPSVNTSGADGNDATGTTGATGVGQNLPPFKNVHYMIRAY